MATPLLSSDALARFAVTVRLGEALARPFSRLSADSAELSPLPRATADALSRTALFKAPLERAVLLSSGAREGAALNASALDDAANTPEGRLAVLLVAEPFARVQGVALRLAAAALQKQVLGEMRKVERQRLRAALGPDNFLIATQEAPTLHAALSALGGDAPVRDALAGPDEATRAPLSAYGLALLAAFLRVAQAPLAPLFEARLPRDAAAHAALDERVAPLQRAVVKFIRRRAPEWSAIIG